MVAKLNTEKQNLDNAVDEQKNRLKEAEAKITAQEEMVAKMTEQTADLQKAIQEKDYVLHFANYLHINQNGALMKFREDNEALRTQCLLYQQVLNPSFHPDEEVRADEIGEQDDLVPVTKGSIVNLQDEQTLPDLSAYIEPEEPQEFQNVKYVSEDHAGSQGEAIEAVDEAMDYMENVQEAIDLELGEPQKLRRSARLQAVFVCKEEAAKTVSRKTEKKTSTSAKNSAMKAHRSPRLKAGKFLKARKK
ncbi:hypothetical protein L596_001214 [Steinernema carpocapsae]|nr:hypothetical protein L596_001214 [Steinernema carpocapsae]